MNDYDDEYAYDYQDYPEDDPGFRDPGGESALRAATPTNPRNLPCPTCHWPNRLTPLDVALHYQCDSCADALERGLEYNYYDDYEADAESESVSESEFQADDCLNYDSDNPEACRGPVELRTLNGIRWHPRCERHFDQRLRQYENSIEQETQGNSPPASWFDETLAGERWSDDY